MLAKTTRTIVVIFGLFVTASLLLKYGGVMGTTDASNSTALSQPAPQASSTLSSANAVTPSVTDDDTSQRVPVSPDGHFYVDAVVGSTALRFLVDTGATSVALTRSDAAHLGIVLDEADFTGWASTANGEARFAPIVLNSVRIDGNWMYDVDAVVIDADGSHSLLGMSYLRRLKGFEVSARAMTLRWN